MNEISANYIYIQMKKIFPIAYIILMLYSCKSMYYSEKVYTLDFSKYTKEGFYIYPKEVTPLTLKYDPISDITITFKSGVLTKEHDPSQFTVVDRAGFSGLAIPTSKYILDKVVQEAKKHKANALINFNIRYLDNFRKIEVSAIAVHIEKE